MLFSTGVLITKKAIIAAAATAMFLIHDTFILMVFSILSSSQSLDNVVTFSSWGRFIMTGLSVVLSFDLSLTGIEMPLSATVSSLVASLLTITAPSP